jgi:hypothetical protein
MHSHVNQAPPVLLVTATTAARQLAALGWAEACIPLQHHNKCLRVQEEHEHGHASPEAGVPLPGVRQLAGGLAHRLHLLLLLLLLA